MGFRIASLALVIVLTLTVPIAWNQRLPANDEKPVPEGRSIRKDLYDDPLPECALVRMGTVRYRTRATVATFSPDGEWLAASSGDRTIDFWDPSSGRLLRQITIPSWGIKTLAFSLDSVCPKHQMADVDRHIIWEVTVEYNQDQSVSFPIRHPHD